MFDMLIQYFGSIPFQMGIHDIFEPNKADFSPMTDEFGIYARHVEQSITIKIRTHANNQLRSKCLDLEKSGSDSW